MIFHEISFVVVPKLVHLLVVVVVVVMLVVVVASMVVYCHLRWVVMVDWDYQ